MRILASAVVAAAAAAVLGSTTASSLGPSHASSPFAAFVPSSHRRGGGGPYYSSSVRSVAREKTRPSLVVVAAATTSEEVEESQGEGASLPPTSPSVAASKSRLLALAKALSPQFGGESLSGVFVTDADRLEELKTAAAELEAVCGPSYNRGERARQLLVGDWTLLCTAVTSRRGMDGGKSKKSKKKEGKGLPFKLPENPLAKEQQRIREKIRRSVEVTQRIRTADSGDEEGSSSNDIARVDNVVEFSPPFQTLSDILGGDSGDVGGPFKDLKINPLEVKKTKVTLIHDASVESVSPVLRTKISLKSVVLTVAGTSRYLDPDGADVLGLNVPLGDFLNAGNFDTTYVDENLRISRGKGSGRGGGLAPEVLRVFVRKGMMTQEDDEAALEDDAAAARSGEDEEPEKEEKSELLSSAERLRDAVGDAIKDAAAAAEDAAESMTISLTDSAAEVQSAAEDVRSAARARAEEVAKEVRDDAEEAAKELEDRLEEAAAAVVGKEDAAKVRDVVDTATQDAIAGVKNVTEALRDAAEEIGSAAEGGAGKVRDAARNAAETLNDDAERAARVAGEVAEDVAEAVRESVAADNQEEEDKEEEEEEEDKKEGDTNEIVAEDDDKSEPEKGE